MNDNKEQVSGHDNAGDVQPCCEGSSCCPSGSDGRGKNWKIVVFILVVGAAGMVLARSFINKSNSTADQGQQPFATIQPELEPDIPSPLNTPTTLESTIEAKKEIESPPVAEETIKQDVSVKTAPSLWGAQLDSLASLGKVAADVDAVFIVLAAEDMQPVNQKIEVAAEKVQAGGTRIRAFTLEKKAPNYARLAQQFSIPCVLMMVKGRGSTVVSGDITEAKLLQGFVAASRPRAACGPAGCGPAGCGPKPANPANK
jgi:hypothetical protein